MQEVLQVCEALSPEQNAQAKVLLDRIVAMLTKLGRRGYAIDEGPGEYRAGRNDTDPDTDADTDPDGALNGRECPRLLISVFQ